MNAPVISKEARRNVQACLESGWVSSAGPYVRQFEEAFATYVGRKYGIAVSNGTAALHVALCAAGVAPGDEVIVPAFTMIATIFSVLYTGATPVFIDCELETFNMDTSQIEARITPRTKAILPVHLFGHPCEMDVIEKIAQKHGLLVIEDAAEAHGALFRGRKCGSFGDLSCFSFYANKIITTGEGGMILTDDETLAKKARKYRDLCHSDSKRFIHEDVGFNYRLTNLQAAIGLGELHNIEHYLAKKKHIAQQYQKRLSSIPGLRLPTTRPHVTNVHWMYAVLIDPVEFGMNKETLRQKLREHQIDTRDLFYPPEDQPALKKRFNLKTIHPNAAYAAHNGCYLPSGLALTDAQIDRVCSTIQAIQEAG